MRRLEAMRNAHHRQPGAGLHLVVHTHGYVYQPGVRSVGDVRNAYGTTYEHNLRPLSVQLEAVVVRGRHGVVEALDEGDYQVRTVQGETLGGEAELSHQAVREIHDPDGGALFFFSSRRRHTRFDCDWSSDVCSSDLALGSELLDALARAGTSEVRIEAVAVPVAMALDLDARAGEEPRCKDLVHAKAELIEPVDRKSVV